jgi:hypothetical protein
MAEILDGDLFDKAIQTLVSRHDECLNLDGEYMEY